VRGARHVMPVTRIAVNTNELHDQLEKIQGGFRQIPQHLARQYLKAAARKGANIFVKPLREITKRRKGKGKGQGALKRSIKTAAKFYKNNSGAGATGVVFYSKKNNLGFHSWMLESGTKQRQNKKGANRGAGPAMHMMRDTNSSYRGQAIDQVISSSIRGLTLAIRDMESPKYQPKKFT
jgi:hypothetical protein